MAFNVVAQDAIISLKDGGAWDGSATLGSSTSVTAFATLVEVDPTLSTYNKPALGDTVERHRPNMQGGQCRLTLNILDSGPLLAQGSLGNVMQVSYNPRTGLTAVTYNGILIGNNFRAQAGQEQEQTLLLQIGVDGTVS